MDFSALFHFLHPWILSILQCLPDYSLSLSFLHILPWSPLDVLSCLFPFPCPNYLLAHFLHPSSSLNMITEPSQKFTIFSSWGKSLVKGIRATLTQYSMDAVNIDLIELDKILGREENFSQWKQSATEIISPGNWCIPQCWMLLRFG